MSDPLPTQAQAYTADGSPIAPEDVGRALDEGTAHYAADASVAVVSPYGLTERVSGADLPTRLAEGYRVEGVERVAQREEALRYSTVGQAAIAGAEGFASGATLGVADLIAAGVDPEYAREAAKRAEYQGLARVGGEIGGGLALAVATGGGGLASVGKTAASRIGRAALVGAAEGAIYGGATGTARELRDERLTADPSGSAARILADVGLYGLLGGALGAGLHGLGEAGGRLVRGAERVAPEAAEGAERAARGAADGAPEGWLAKQADYRAREAIGGAAAVSGRRPLREGIGTRLLDEGIPLDDPAAAAARLGELRVSAGQRMSTLVAESPAPVSLSELGARVAESRAKMVASEASEEALKRFDQAAAPIVERVAKEPEGFVTAAVTDRLRKQVRDGVAKAQRKLFKKKIGEEGYPIAELNDHVTDALAGALDAAGDGRAAEFRRAMADYRTFAAAEGAAKAHADQVSRAPTIAQAAGSAWSTVGLVGSLASGNVLPAVAGLAAQSVQSTLQKRGAAIAARLAYSVSRGEVRIGSIADRMVGVPRLAIETASRLAPAAAPPAARMTARTALAEYQRAAEPAILLRDRPEEFRERLAEAVAPIAEEHPELAAEVARQATGAAAELVRRLPRNLTQTTLTPQLAKSIISPEAARDFVRAAEVMRDPDVVLDAIDRGDASWLDLQALKRGAPEVWSQLREAVVARLPSLTKEIPFGLRVQYGLLFDLPAADYSLAPHVIAALQAAQARPQESPQPTRSLGSGPSQGARFAGQLALAGDKMERRT